MRGNLEQYQEVQTEDDFGLQNPKLLKVTLDGRGLQAKAGAMVAFQGDLKFEARERPMTPVSDGSQPPNRLRSIGKGGRKPSQARKQGATRALHASDR